jgi:DNA invertase Pin-like site-specific DNA recombinase
MRKNGMLIGYARVSKAEAQDTVVQVKALRQAGCKRIFEEKTPGGRWERPQLHQALEQLCEGDVPVVWKLDRLTRPLKDLLHIMERVREAGAGFRSLTEAVDGYNELCGPNARLFGLHRSNITRLLARANVEGT